MSHVAPIKHKKFIQLLKKNGFVYDRSSGNHDIYVRNGSHISVPYDVEINAVLARRLIKENNLK